MIWFLGIYGFLAAFSVVSFFGDMSSANGAPQQCVAAAVALFTLLVPYTALKAFHCWKSSEQNDEIIALLKKR